MCFKNLWNIWPLLGGWVESNVVNVTIIWWIRNLVCIFHLKAAAWSAFSLSHHRCLKENICIFCVQGVFMVPFCRDEILAARYIYDELILRNRLNLCYKHLANLPDSLNQWPQLVFSTWKVSCMEFRLGKLCDFIMSTWVNLTIILA